jgi:2-oxoglutarate dehydrogenase E2 component (dihydrolipoamide succinyltransferase)
MAAIEARERGTERPAPAAAERESQAAKPASEPARAVSRAEPARAEAPAAAKAEPAAPAARPAAVPTPSRPAPSRPAAVRPAGAREERVKMTRLRRRIAERLKEAQNTAAILTTYNEADMSAVMALRQRYRDSFEKKHGVRLGFMSFFVKAAINALQAFPAVNAEIDGDEIVYKRHYDIGVAVGTPSGLVVPVIRDADQLGFAEIEKTINELGARARDGQLAMEDLMGGTFTISNGGVYGSLMSSPILNPPQVGILGMHKIQERPVALKGEIVIRPMMYLALSYDHRIVDGREAVSFLVRVKECVEDPERLLLDI